MKIRVLDDSTPQTPSIQLRDTSFGVDSARVGNAISQAGGQLFSAFAPIAREQATDEAVKAAKQIPTRNEEGKIVTPELPQNDNGMFGPTIYEQAFQKQLLDQYTDELTIDARDHFSTMHASNRLDVKAFNEESDVYIKGLVDSMPGQWSGQLDRHLRAIQGEHSANIGMRISEFQYRKSVETHDELRKSMVTDIASMYTNGADMLHSDDLQDKFDLYHEHMAKGLDNQYYTEDSMIAYDMELAESINVSKLSNVLGQYPDTVEGGIEASNYINSIRTGEAEIQAVVLDKNGDPKLSTGKIGSVFSQDKLNSIASGFTTLHNAEKKYRSEQASFQIENYKNELEKSVSGMKIAMMMGDEGAEVPRPDMGELFNTYQSIIERLSSDDPFVRETMLTSMQAFTAKKMGEASSSWRTRSVENNLVAKLYDQKPKIIDRIRELENSEPGLFTRASGGADMKSWLGSIRGSEEQIHRQMDLINNQYQQMMWMKSGKSGGKMQIYTDEYIGWLKRIEPIVNAFNEKNYPGRYDGLPGLTTMELSKEAFQHAIRAIAPPNFRNGKEATKWMDAIYQADAYEHGVALDWSHVDSNFNDQQRLIKKYSFMGIVPSGLSETMRAIGNQELMPGDQQMQRMVGLYDELQKYPQMKGALAKEAVLGANLNKAYKWLSESGFGIQSQKGMDKFQRIARGEEEIYTWATLTKEQQNDLSSEFNDLFAMNNYIFDDTTSENWDGYKAPAMLRQEARKYAAMFYDVASDAQGAAQMAFDHAVNKLGYEKSYVGWSDQFGKVGKDAGENTYRYTFRPPEYFARKGQLSEEYVYGSTGMQFARAFDIDADVPMMKDFNRWAKDNIGNAPEGGIKLGRNAALRFRGIGDQGPEYSVILKGNTPGYDVMALPHQNIIGGVDLAPVFRPAQFEKAWKLKKLNELEAKGNDERRFEKETKGMTGGVY